MLLKLKINNNEVIDHNTSIRIVDGYPILTWEMKDINVVSINTDDGTFEESYSSFQKSYEIRVGNSSVYLGTDAFIGNLSKVNVENSQEMYWKYSGFPIQRGNTYYGQVRIVDNLDRDGDWFTFSFSYYEKPQVYNVRIVPYNPLLGQEIEIKFDGGEEEGNDVLVKWYRNGSYSPEFNNFLKISSRDLNDGDTFVARLVIYDGYEYSETYSTNKVIIRDKKNIVSDIKIIPSNPNYDDILKVDYNVDDFRRYDDVKIRWYINDSLDFRFNNRKFIRPNCNVGDSVRVSVSSVEENNYKSSDYVYIVEKDFIIKDILVDGKIDPLDVSSITPNISWKVLSPKNKLSKYISIKIGTFYEADNIYSKIVNYGINNFTVPYNVMEKGRDYFISIAASDSMEFKNYSYARIRIIGSRWELNVNNEVGWTMETFFDIKGGAEDNDDDKMHTLKIYDGTNFAEINIYEDIEDGNKISLISGEVIHYNIGDSKYGLLTVAGKGNDIKVYFDRDLIIDGSGVFNQSTDIKKIEIGCFNNSKLQINYKYFVYTTKGYFLPGQSSEYINLQFHKFIEFKDNDIVALNKFSGGKNIFATNPHDKNKSSVIYNFISDDFSKYGTTTKSFYSINKINKSLNNKYISAGYSKGLINVENYFISLYKNEILFIDRDGIEVNDDPEEKGWELVSDNMNVSDVHYYYNENGFNINTIGNN